MKDKLDHNIKLIRILLLNPSWYTALNKKKTILNERTNDVLKISNHLTQRDGSHVTLDISYLLCPSVFPKITKVTAYKCRNTELAIHVLPEMNVVTWKRI